MSQNKYLAVGGVSVAFALLAGGGFWYWHSHRAKPVANQSNASTSDQTQSTDTSGLRVSGSGASNLGQLGGGQSQASAGQNPGGSTDPVDPSQFAQYDKYKDAQNGLFGDVKVGDGAELTAGKTAAVYYKGWLTSGQLFDQTKTNSDGSQQPFIFTLGAHNVIPGFEQAAAGMKVGGTRLLIIPPAVGYGAQGQGPVPPNSVLIFEVQLVQVQ